MSTITTAAVGSPRPMTSAQLRPIVASTPSARCRSTRCRQAKSGHPGTPMALAPLVYTLWNRVMRFDPQDPIWPNRDRFVLSNGHASMLLWSVLHLTGTQAVNADYERLGQPAVTLDDIRRFRQLGSKAPGPSRIPLGLGRRDHDRSARAGHRHQRRHGDRARSGSPTATTGRASTIFDYNIYAVCGDGCLMEGVGSEAASLAGHLGLDNLCWIYDNNHITIEGNTRIAFTEDVAARFLGYGWNVLRVGDANDIERIEHALDDLPQDQGPADASSSSTATSATARRTSRTPPRPTASRSARTRSASPSAPTAGPRTRSSSCPTACASTSPPASARAAREARARLDRAVRGLPRASIRSSRPRSTRCSGASCPPAGTANLPVFPADPKGIAGRDASGKVLNVLAQNIPWLLGGSADLGPSNKTTLTFEGAGDFEPGTPGGRNLHFGIREHAMAAIVNGLSLSKLRPFGATFFIFSDYARPAIRLSALMELPTIFVFTHDAMGDGEDGPTHQPVEQLASLRAIPGLVAAAARRRQRGRRGVPLHHAAAPPAGGAGAVAPAAADARPQQIRAGCRVSRAAPTCSPTPRAASPK